jgi:hypothetical protein
MLIRVMEALYTLDHASRDAPDARLSMHCCSRSGQSTENTQRGSSDAARREGWLQDIDAYNGHGTEHTDRAHTPVSQFSMLQHVSDANYKVKA